MFQGNELKFVKYDVNDDEQLTFIKKHLRVFYTKEIGSWQYKNEGQHTGLFLAKNNGQYIATQGMIPMKLIHNGKHVFSAKSETSFLLSEFRGRGVFEELYFYTISCSESDNITLIWGFTALAKVWREKLKFDVYEKVVQESELQLTLFKSIYSALFVTESIKAKGRALLKCFAKSRVNIKRIKPDKDYCVRELDLNNKSDLESVVSLYKSWTKNNPSLVCIDFNQAFLKWRILDNPILNYVFGGVYKNNTLLGYGIINIDKRRAYLVDFIVAEKKDLEDCFGALLAFLDKQPISHLNYWANSKNAYAKSIHTVFTDCGADYTIKDSLSFVVKPINSTPTERFNIDDFYFNSLWTEGFSM